MFENYNISEDRSTVEQTSLHESKITSSLLANNFLLDSLALNCVFFLDVAFMISA